MRVHIVNLTTFVMVLLGVWDASAEELPKHRFIKITQSPDYESPDEDEGKNSSSQRDHGDVKMELKEFRDTRDLFRELIFNR
jgi:hypothetical protein